MLLLVGLLKALHLLYVLADHLGGLHLPDDSILDSSLLGRVCV